MSRPGLVPSILCVVALLLSFRALAQENDRRLRQVIDFQRENRAVLFVPGVQGTAIRYDDGQPTLVIYVNPGLAQAVAVRRLLEDARRKDIPADAEVVSRFVALAGIPMGKSTGSVEACISGTLGIAATRDGKDGYITAAHVATAAKPRFCPNGDVKEQVSPGRGDDRQCSMTTTIGKLVKAARIPADGYTAGTVDAAFVESATVDSLNACGICPGSLAILDENKAAHDKIDVLACGKESTTAKSGKVMAIEAEVWVDFQCFEAMFVGQIIVEGQGFGPPGHSGAVVYGKDGVLGLIFAGDTAKTTIVNPMAGVLKALDINTNAIRCTN